ncbi:unnamed protein product [Durusdinium trenchii]|uniref:Uncharacterized protein n=1 Tax=Durusdinium trenchii TaxID=1381693 RepID=A0ABP0P5U4_9DINO
MMHRCCGAFLACLDQFTSSVPTTFADACLTEIHKTFELRHGDADLQALLEHSVPPASLSKILRLSQQLLQTTWQQCQLQIDGDLLKLKDWAGAFNLYAQQQAALDYKHINDRYMKGKEWLAGFTKEKHTMTSHSSIVLSHSLIVNMQQDMGPDGLTILIVDATLWPSRQLSIDESINIAQTVSSGNARTMAFFCLPQTHTSTKRDVVLKNRRLLEDKVGAYLECVPFLSHSAGSLHKAM